MVMKTRIKIGNETFEVNLQTPENISSLEVMSDWCKLVEQQTNNEDVWTTIPQLPQYRFKNLRIVGLPFVTTDDINEINVTIKCDEYDIKED